MRRDLRSSWVPLPLRFRSPRRDSHLPPPAPTQARGVSGARPTFSGSPTSSSRTTRAPAAPAPAVPSRSEQLDVPYVPYVPTSLTSPRPLRPHVPFVPYVSTSWGRGHGAGVCFRGKLVPWCRPANSRSLHAQARWLLETAAGKQVAGGCSRGAGRLEEDSSAWGAVWRARPPWVPAVPGAEGADGVVLKVAIRRRLGWAQACPSPQMLWKQEAGSQAHQRAPAPTRDSLVQGGGQGPARGPLLGEGVLSPLQPQSQNAEAVGLGSEESCPRRAPEPASRERSVWSRVWEVQA